MNSLIFLLSNQVIFRTDQISILLGIISAYLLNDYSDQNSCNTILDKLYYKMDGVDIGLGQYILKIRFLKRQIGNKKRS